MLSTKLQSHDLRATFKTSIQNLCVRAKSLHSSIVHVTLSRCKACHQNLTSVLLTLHQLSLLSSTCAFPFATDIDVDYIACKIGALFQLNITAVENEILFPWKWHRDKIQGIQWNREDLGTVARREIFHYKKIWFLYISLFWINLSVWICIFSHEDNKIQTQIDYDRSTSSGLLETCNHQPLPWLRGTSYIAPEPGVSLTLKWMYFHDINII